MKDGKLVTLAEDIKRQQLKEWRQSTAFFCPQCSLPVQLKVGEIVIPHFAHQKDASCLTSFSEGETKEHLMGKRHLFSFFKQHVEKVELEPYIKEISQRPDLLVTYGSHRIPIEFQCSTIPLEVIASRSDGYRNKGMQSIWILCTPAKLKLLREDVGIIQLSRFHERFLIPSSPEGPILFTFDPHKEKFHYYSSLIHLVGKRYIGIHRTLSSSSQTFPFAQPKIPSETEVSRFFAIYSSVRHTFLKSRILLNRKGVNDPFLRACYELRILPEHLPNWIGVPVHSNGAFKEHDCEWQMALVRYMQTSGIRFHTLSDNHIRKFISNLESPSELKEQACLEYRDFLNDISEGIYTMGKDIGDSNIMKLITDRFLAK